MADRLIPLARARRAVSFLLLAGALAAAGCTKKEERMYFDGKYYPIKARASDKADRKTFTVSVRRADQGLAGAREAGRYGGKQYCLKNYGTSEIRWIVGPDTPQSALGYSGGRLALSGTCVLW